MTTKPKFSQYIQQIHNFTTIFSNFYQIFHKTYQKKSFCTNFSTNSITITTQKKKRNFETYYTNISAFAKVGQEAPILEEPISATHKLHIISIETRVKNLPVPLVPNHQAQLGEPGPSRLKRGRPINGLNWVVNGFQEAECPSKVLALHCLLVLPPFPKSCSRFSGSSCVTWGCLEGKKREVWREKVLDNDGVWKRSEIDESHQRWLREKLRLFIISYGFKLNISYKK